MLLAAQIQWIRAIESTVQGDPITELSNLLQHYDFGLRILEMNAIDCFKV
jgi:hypothetical protein